MAKVVAKLNYDFDNKFALMHLRADVDNMWFYDENNPYHSCYIADRSIKIYYDDEMSYSSQESIFLLGDFLHNNDQTAKNQIYGPVTDITYEVDSDKQSVGPKGSVKYSKVNTIGMEDFFDTSLNDDTFTAVFYNGNDIITGNKGDDVLRGYGGNDKLNGKAGFNELWGGRGGDTFKVSDKKGWVSVLMDYDKGYDVIDLPGKPGSWGKYGYHHQDGYTSLGKWDPKEQEVYDEFAYILGDWVTADLNFKSALAPNGNSEPETSQASLSIIEGLNSGEYDGILRFK